MFKSVGIDIDGVLADFTTAFVKVLREKLHIDIPAEYVPQDWGWISANLPPKAMDRAWRIIDTQEDFWLGLSPMMPNVLDLEWFFKEHAGKDFDVYFITARKDGAGHSVKSQSEVWLRHWMNKPDAPITVLPVNSGMDKVDVLHALSVDYCIDDHTPTIVNAKSAYKKGKAFLLDQPWNQDGEFYNVKRVAKLKDFFDIITKES